MRSLKFPILLFTVLLSVSVASAQRTEITIGLSEHFFDTLLDAVFQNGGPPEFALSQNSPGQVIPSQKPSQDGTGFAQSFSDTAGQACNESIKLQRENNGVRTAVRFRDGKIYAPLAFTGNYNPPLIGCVGFGGYAETNIEMEFDPQGQRLIARAKVLNVSLNGTNGLGASVITRLVQSSIDKKVNPMEVVSLEKISFGVPIQNGQNLKMKAVGIKQEVVNGVLLIRIAYEFVKA
jgi:hypothetical protein